MKKATWIAVALIGVMVFSASAFADGATVFAAKCKMCHGADGKKLAKADLSGATVQAKTDAALVTFLTTEAKHKTRVTDEATAKSLVTFLRTLKK